MDEKLYALIVLSVLPWLYLGMDLLLGFASHMNGFGYLPFFALLLLKEKVFYTQREHGIWTLIPNLYLRYTVIVVLATFLTVVVVYMSSWIREAIDVFGEKWLWVLFGLLALAFVGWDVKYAYLRNRERPEAHL